MPLGNIDDMSRAVRFRTSHANCDVILSIRRYPDLGGLDFNPSQILLGWTGAARDWAITSRKATFRTAEGVYRRDHQGFGVDSERGFLIPAAHGDIAV